MEISVIIPSYKPGDYIWECLKSLYIQTLSKNLFETILVLNGCCEPWKSKIEKWIATHPKLNIHFIQTDEGGVSNARNIGLNSAQGKYIAFIDDDDYVSPRYLEAMLNIANRNSIVLSDSLAFEDGKKEFDHDYLQHKTFQICKLINNCTLYKARSIFNGPCMKLIPSCFIKNCRFDILMKNGEDSLFMFEISRYIKHIKFSEDAIYYRRFRPMSATTAHRSISKYINNAIKMMYRYTRIWLVAPFSYNLPFVLSRYAAAIKTIIKGFKCSKNKAI